MPKQTKFVRPAVQIRQGELTLYLTYVTPRDLFNGDFYTVDKLEPSDEDTGFQRILSTPRANRLARHLKEAEGAGYANLPTTIFLATDHAVKFDSGILTFSRKKVCPLSVVDGQHRIEGLRAAIGDDDGSPLWDFKLPATIAVELDQTHQMYHFYIVNTTQKPVEKDLAQQITKRFTDMSDIEDLPYLPHWFDREVRKGVDALAIRLVDYLNTEESSPMKGLVAMANEERVRGQKKIRQASLVNLYKQHLFTNVNPISSEVDSEKQRRILLNYYRAVDRVFVHDSERSLVFRGNNGQFFFSLVSKWIFTEMLSEKRPFSVDSIQEVIDRTMENLSDDYADMAEPEWWESGRHGVGGMSRPKLRDYATGFLAALRRAGGVEMKL